MINAPEPIESNPTPPTFYGGTLDYPSYWQNVRTNQVVFVMRGFQTPGRSPIWQQVTRRAWMLSYDLKIMGGE